MFSKLFNKKKEDRDGKKDKDTFSFFTVQEEDKTYIYRSRNNMQRYAKSRKYPYQIGIAVPLYSINNGFPSKEENEQLLILERILEKEFSKNNIALFVGAIMGGGMKEFVFYTGNHKAAAKIYERLKDEIKHHELQCMIQEDPDWKTYKILNGK